MNTLTAIVPSQEIDSRIENLQKELAKSKLDGTLILQKTDLFYFSGTIQDAHLYIPMEGKPLLMVYKSHARARAESPLEQVVPLKSPKALLQMITDHGLPTPQTIGMELDVIPANHFMRYQKMLHPATVVDVSHAIRLVRAIKSPWEIEQIAMAASFSDQLAAALPTLLESGDTELALAGKIEALARKLGHQGIVRMRMWGGEMFYGHLMAGPDAATPSFLASPTGGVGASAAVAQGAGHHIIRKNEPILFDYVFIHNGYVSDHTRIFVKGRLPDHLLKAHDAMLTIEATLKKSACPGAIAGDLYDQAITLATHAGLADFFMGAAKRRIQFLGHGVGLELDEYPFLAKGQQMRLEEGMVIALEPKVIMPDYGVVGIENTHLVTDDGFKALWEISEWNHLFLRTPKKRCNLK